MSHGPFARMLTECKVDVHMHVPCPSSTRVGALRYLLYVDYLLIMVCGSFMMAGDGNPSICEREGALVKTTSSLHVECPFVYYRIVIIDMTFNFTFDCKRVCGYYW